MPLPLDAAERNHLRNFFSERFAQERSNLSELHVTVLRALPIFVHLPNWAPQQPNEETRFVSLLTPNLHLPNPAFTLRSYGPNFLQLSNEREGIKTNIMN